MKIKMMLLLVFLNAATAFAQEKLEVFFDFNKFDLNEAATTQLTVWSSTHKNMEVTKIYGFCDSKGTNLYNDTLSMKRVRTVSDFLKHREIAVKDNFEVRGFGEDFKQSKIQAENRKVLVVYELKKEIVVPNPATIGLQDKIKTSKSGDKIKLEKINFYNMSSRIVPESQNNLYELLCALQENPNLRIEIQGHICCQLSGDINNLSVSRARAVYNYLVSQKISKNRLAFKGFGVTKPIHPIPEKNEQEQDENRRVEVMILSK
ncbi:OmpA family outer membrane protein [Flavobacterium noncentrifugens]|uniref:OmpA family protein n=1 Tax=Flavobacterium noncentrifugens TaxID=1128970 RepID=A0A1G8YU02_9FLAO|nr:OmpA family protein [Flavobacterium noncentrifugens]GEP51361.1 OmpA family outer membrane protein [Flavobacterium noncentrifugens]SDK06319.1 OmpA family protein [Flavobacterium noncentrifugens]